jgi:hypothetical protein
VSHAVFRNLAEAESPGFYYEFHIRGRYPSPVRSRWGILSRLGMLLGIALVIALAPFFDNWNASRTTGESLTPDRLLSSQQALRAADPNNRSDIV